MSSNYVWAGKSADFDVVGWRPLLVQDLLQLEIVLTKSQKRTIARIEELQLAESFKIIADTATRSLLLDEISSKIVHVFTGASSSKIHQSTELDADRLRESEFLLFREREYQKKNKSFDLDAAIRGSSEQGYALFRIELKESMFYDRSILNEQRIEDYLDYAFGGGTGNGPNIDDWRGQITNYKVKTKKLGNSLDNTPPSNLLESCRKIRASMRNRVDLVPIDRLLVVGTLLNKKGYDPDRHTQDYEGCISSDEIADLRKAKLDIGSCNNKRCQSIARFMGEWRHWTKDYNPDLFSDFNWSVKNIGNNDSDTREKPGLLALKEKYIAKQWYGSWGSTSIDKTSERHSNYHEWKGVGAIRSRVHGCDMNTRLTFTFLVNGDDNNPDQIVTLQKVNLQFDPQASGEREGSMVKPLEVEDWKAEHKECMKHTDGNSYML